MRRRCSSRTLRLVELFTRASLASGCCCWLLFSWLRGDLRGNRKCEHDWLNFRADADMLMCGAQLYCKVVEQRRGGYCVEVNALFCWLLRVSAPCPSLRLPRNTTKHACELRGLRFILNGVQELGYETYLRPSTLTFDGGVTYSPPASQASIVLVLDGVFYLVDVGFGSYAARK